MTRTAKIHLTYRVGGVATGAAMCALSGTRPYYHGLAVAFAKEFRHAPSERRCRHCERCYMSQRNAQRRIEGAPQVTSPFEGLDHSQ